MGSPATKGPLLLVQPSGPLPGPIATYLHAVAAGLIRGFLFGGPLAVGDDVLSELVASPFAGGTSPTWSGYIVPSSSQITEVEGEWTVPSLDCAATPNAGAATWLGIGGVTSQSGSSGALLQTGVTTNCVDGSQQDVAWWEERPTTPQEDFADFPVAPGDVISAGVVYDPSLGEWGTVLIDVTSGVVGVMATGSDWGVITSSGTIQVEGSTVGLSYSGGYTAEWIVEDYAVNNVPVSFADYGTVSFSNLATNNPSLSVTPSEGVEMVRGGVVLSIPSAPSADGFSVSYAG